MKMKSQWQLDTYKMLRGTWFTFELSSAERSAAKFFSSSVAVGSLPQIIGALCMIYQKKKDASVYER